MDGQRYRVLISDKARQMMKAHVSFLAEVNPQAAEKLGIPDGRYTKPGTDAGAMSLFG